MASPSLSKVKNLAREQLGDHRVRQLKARRTRISSSLGVGPWRRPSLNGLDDMLIDKLNPAMGGSFIELGANDGVQQSNTYALEREFGWSGLLIEPVPELAAECKRNRPSSTVVCAAIGSGSSGGSSLIGLNYSDLKSSVERPASTESAPILVPVVSLSDAIAAANLPQKIDLLVIDVEGYEMEVLGGLDLDCHRPCAILIETAKFDAVTSRLGALYEFVDQFSKHDYLFERRQDTI